MTWAIAWSFESNRDVREMHPETAARICKAVVDFAGEGSEHFDLVDAADDDPEGSSLYRLRAPGGFALVRIDEAASTLYVSRLVANERLAAVVPLLDDPLLLEPDEDDE